jgi:hypothetical protein
MRSREKAETVACLRIPLTFEMDFKNLIISTAAMDQVSNIVNRVSQGRTNGQLRPHFLRLNFRAFSVARGSWSMLASALGIGWFRAPLPGRSIDRKIGSDFDAGCSRSAASPQLKIRSGILPKSPDP